MARVALSPADFPEYLLLRVGFVAHEATIELPAAHAGSGGGTSGAAGPGAGADVDAPPRRQLLVFRKAG